MKVFKALSRLPLLSGVSFAIGLVVVTITPTIAAVAPITITPSIGFSSLSQALNTMIDFLFFGGALACFGYIVLGALKYLTAGDNSNAVSSARTTITNAIIGLVLLALVFVIFQVIVRIIPGLDSFFSVGGSSTAPACGPSGCLTS